MRGGESMNTGLLAIFLTLFGMLGLLLLSVIALYIFWLYRSSHMGTFRWHIRNHYLKQVAAIACLFCLAMAASYGILLEAWALLYIIIGVKIGTWWLRLTMDQRA
jgi:hypothetical protein